MENNKVEQFVNFLLEGESIEDAVKNSCIGDMKLLDLLKGISKIEYVTTTSTMTVASELLQQLKKLDESLVDLNK